MDDFAASVDWHLDPMRYIGRRIQIKSMLTLTSLLQGKKVSCKLRIRRKATLYSRRDPRRINDMVYIHPLMSSNPSCTLRGPAVVYSFPAAACTTAAMRRHCKSTLKKLLGEDSFQNIGQKASVITVERFSIKNCSDYIKMTKIRTDKRSLHKPPMISRFSPTTDLSRCFPAFQNSLKELSTIV